MRTGPEEASENRLRYCQLALGHLPIGSDMHSLSEQQSCTHGSARVVRQVLIFSTMTRALDIIEENLEWRGLASVRLDGATAADERGSVRTGCAMT